MEFHCQLKFSGYITVTNPRDLTLRHLYGAWFFFNPPYGQVEGGAIGDYLLTSYESYFRCRDLLPFYGPFLDNQQPVIYELLAPYVPQPSSRFLLPRESPRISTSRRRPARRQFQGWSEATRVRLNPTVRIKAGCWSVDPTRAECYFWHWVTR